jgi:hypothetical protein
VDSDDMFPKLSELHYWEANLDGSKKWNYYIQVDEKDYHITYNGMSVDYEDHTIRMSFVPGDRFPGCEEGLTDEQLVFLVGLEVRGERFSREKMYKLMKAFRETQ